MAIKISQMDPFTGNLDNKDIFEMTRISEMKSYSLTAKQMADFVATKMNSGLRGTWTKNLNEMSAMDTGVWYYTGEAPFEGAATTGLVELYTYVDTSTMTDPSAIQAVPYLQRYTTTVGTYIRSHVSAGWGDWMSMTNRNEALIIYGQSDTDVVNWEEEGIVAKDFFNGRTPCVTITPCFHMSDGVDYATTYQLDSVTSKGFTVRRYKSNLSDAYTTEEITEVTNGTKTTTKTTVISHVGQWTKIDSGMPYNWIAVLDYHE